MLITRGLARTGGWLRSGPRFGGGISCIHGTAAARSLSDIISERIRPVAMDLSFKKSIQIDGNIDRTRKSLRRREIDLTAEILLGDQINGFGKDIDPPLIRPSVGKGPRRTAFTYRVQVEVGREDKNISVRRQRIVLSDQTHRVDLKIFWIVQTSPLVPIGLNLGSARPGRSPSKSDLKVIKLSRSRRRHRVVIIKRLLYSLK